MLLAEHLIVEAGRSPMGSNPTASANKGYIMINFLVFPLGILINITAISFMVAGNTTVTFFIMVIMFLM